MNTVNFSRVAKLSDSQALILGRCLSLLRGLEVPWAWTQSRLIGVVSLRG
jgi:hypothetical protein